MSLKEKHNLFGAIEPTLLDGFRYAPDVIPDDLQFPFFKSYPNCRSSL